MFQELFERVMQVFVEPPAKKSPRVAKSKSASDGRRKKSRAGAKDRRKTLRASAEDRRDEPRASAKDRRKSKLRVQDWNERDNSRRKSTNFIWEGYVPK